MPLVRRKLVEHIPPPDPRALAAVMALEEAERSGTFAESNESSPAAGSSAPASAAAGKGRGKGKGHSNTCSPATARAMSQEEELPDPEVFYLAKTGEIFLDYESYAARLAFYNQKIFQCELTGKIGLSYWQAVESERREAQELHRRFPEALKGHVLRSIQFVVTGRLDNLVDLLFERFKDRFWPDESVLVEVQGDRYHARIKDAFPSRSLIKKHQQRVADGQSTHDLVAGFMKLQASSGKKGKVKVAAKPEASDNTSMASINDGSPSKSQLPHVHPVEILHRIGTDLSIDAKAAIAVDDPAEYLYAIQLVDNDGKFTGSLMEVRAKVLSRDRLAFSKTILRKYIRTCVVRDASIGAPWIVRHVIAHRYGIPINPSDEVRRKNLQMKEEKLQKRKKVVEEEPGADDAASAEEEETKPKRKRRKKDVPTKSAEEIAAEEEKVWQEEEEKRRAEKRKTVKFPWEDLDLGAITNRELASRMLEEEVARRRDRPKPKRGAVDDPCGRMAGEWFERFIGAYHFLISCGKALRLSNFTLDDFEAALRHDSPDAFPTLITEAHATLLNVIIGDSMAPATTTSATVTRSVSGSSGCGAPKERIVSARVAARNAASAIAENAAVVAANGTPAGSRANSEEVDELASDTDDCASAGGAPASQGAGNGCVDGEVDEDVEFAAVRDAARQIGKNWRARLLVQDRSRAGWDAALVGCLVDCGDRATFPRLAAILSLLTGVQHPDALVDPCFPRTDGEVAAKAFTADTYAAPLERYLQLAFEDRLRIFTFLAEQAAMTKAVRGFFDECDNQLTELRKERIEMSRVRKRILEERAELEGWNKEKQEDDKESNEGDASRIAGSGSEDDELQSEDEAAADDDDDEDGTHRAARQSRRKKLEDIAKRKKEAEAEKQKQQEAARAAQKLKLAESKHLNNERKRLDEEQAKLDSREEAIEREFRRLSLAPRLVPLGRDRFFEKYWWFDGVGEKPLLNAQGQAQYLVGRLYVQGCGEEDMLEMEELSEVPRRWMEVQERMKDEYGGEEGMLSRNEWAVYDDPEEVS
ncbi:hypothetical protein K437DRAFT_133069 [Tilletiaria anomala UBC 951]|uniref:WAC domain-containing protein n=1 Tax=Tilletiaria anomala (strain ATCC 24038 / CBS 436.72 / UBC 951) TaxID=1037660 RepID=A0A066WK50_TILAU|nr:uncharacterized protein K437DRAFT_133069 [Tilletiaria anomala UBC 951]KDN52943.1 hypothetical protein K437DRAFT_133069 [Tilletiaria anomala UBC 951]